MAQTIVSATDVKIRLSELLERVAEDGEEITISRRGKPVAKLVPLRKRRRARCADSLTDEEWEELERAADSDIAAGRVYEYTTIEEMIAALEARRRRAQQR